jgi:hypothetical protein
MGPFRYEDCKYILMNLPPESAAEIAATRGAGPEVPTQIADMCEIFKRYAAICYKNGEPVAIMGAIPCHAGVWTAYMLATTRMSEVVWTLTKWARRVFFPALRDLGAHRVEAQSIATYHKTHRWIRAIGAKQEALIPRFGRNREDFIRFVYMWD